MKMSFTVLQCGNSEPLKTGFHATTLGLCAVMGLYNAAAWLSRRQRHLAVNALVYTALTIWEQRHVAHHLAELRKCHEPVPQPTPAAETTTSVVAELAA
jgi:hypothetical protein